MCVLDHTRIALSVNSPERTSIARVQAGLMIVNQIEPALFQGTVVRFGDTTFEDGLGRKSPSAG